MVGKRIGKGERVGKRSKLVRLNGDAKVQQLIFTAINHDHFYEGPAFLKVKSIEGIPLFKTFEQFALSRSLKSLG